MGLDGRRDASVGHDAAEFTFTVENAGTELITLSFQSGAVADVWAAADGAEVWCWSDGRMFTQALESATLAPGESVSHTMTWTDPVPWRYTAEDVLRATNLDVSDRLGFQVGWVATRWGPVSRRSAPAGRGRRRPSPGISCPG